MAQPTEFKGQNVVYAKDQPEYLPLPAFRDSDGSVITCWKFTPDELERIAKSGEVFIKVLTFNQPLQPMNVQAGLEDFIELF